MRRSEAAGKISANKKDKTLRNGTAHFSSTFLPVSPAVLNFVFPPLNLLVGVHNLPYIQSKSQRQNDKSSVIDLVKTYLHSDSNYHSIPDVLGKTRSLELLTEKEESRPVTMLWNKHVVISLFCHRLWVSQDW